MAHGRAGFKNEVVSIAALTYDGNGITDAGTGWFVKN